jgi:hypothetical protein
VKGEKTVQITTVSFRNRPRFTDLLDVLKLRRNKEKSEVKGVKEMRSFTFLNEQNQGA